MERIEKTVFISYRRTNFPWALAIYQNLTEHGYDAFLDFKGIASGDFEQAILGNITTRAHFVLVLTPSALERCDQPGDWLRREIETAMATQRNVVPVMLDGFSFKTATIANQLTGKLAAVKSYNSLSVPPEYFDEAMARLRERFLSVPLIAVLHPASLAATQAATEQKAAAEAAPAVQESELSAQQWFERAFEATDAEEQVRLYSEAIRLKPDFFEAINNRGNAWFDRGEWLEAIKDYSEAIRIRPEDANTFLNRANARMETGDVAGVMDDCNEAIRIKPDHARSFYIRGRTRFALNDNEGAIADCNEAIRLKPDDVGVFCGRGFALAAKGDCEGAIRDFKEAIRLNPETAEAFRGLGDARYEKGEFEQAIKDSSEAIRLRPQFTDAYYGRGCARGEIGDFAGAIDDFSEAIRLNPNLAVAFYNRSRARKENGDLQGAEEDMKEAERLRAAG